MTRLRASIVIGGPERLSASGPSWPVDGHVHFHSMRRVASTMDSAASNFHAACGRSQGLIGALLLAEASREHVFESLHEEPLAGSWRFTVAAEETETLVARRGEQAVAVVAGKQVRAMGGLEVLALGTRAKFEDGLSLARTIRAVLDSGGLPVLPWGFGKWLGERGRLVVATLAEFGPAQVFVGDNGGRLQGLGVPAPLGALAQRGFRVIPGTDPFPFGSDHRRVGGFGFGGVVPPTDLAPWRELRGWLVERRTSPIPYGRASGPLRFLRNQVGIQLHNRLVRSRSP